MRAMRLNSTPLTRDLDWGMFHFLVCLLALFSVCGCSGSNKNLFDAVQDRDMDRVRALLRANPQAVHSTDHRGATPLHYTALWGYPELTKLMLDKGAKVNAVQRQGNTALHWAATCGHDSVVKVLLDHGADIRAENANGKTALHSAVCIGELYEPSRAVVAMLLDHGADINARDERSWTPLHWAAVMRHANIAKFLIARGADYDVFAAAAMGDTKRLGELLGRQPDLACSTTLAGLTPLHLAANGGKLPIAELLLAQGADVNAADRAGDTPLHATAEGNHPEVARLLLAHNADANARNRNGETASERASSRHHPEMAQLLEAPASSR